MDTSTQIAVPLDVPSRARQTYLDNYRRLTRGSGRLMLMAGDQKVEHLNDDFVGRGVADDDADPEHFFRIASQAHIGAFASQLGLIVRYAADYRDIPYVVKLNSKTNLVKTSQRDPLSRQWQTIEQLGRLRDEAGLKIAGVGYTIYPGSELEHEMLGEAARLVFEAHQLGLLAIIWAYPRGKAVAEEHDPHLIAGACGLVACLGADFAKVNYPEVKEGRAAERLQEAVRAAGRTKVICAGGEEAEVGQFLARLHEQIHVGGAAGNATGRNIHQRPLEEAIRFCNAIYALTVEGAGVEDALRVYHHG